jgi:hypothetical protein
VVLVVVGVACRGCEGSPQEGKQKPAHQLGLEL